MAVTEIEEALQGSLADFPLPNLLRTLAGSRQTGVLEMQGGDQIWVSEGRIYLATSPNAASIANVLCNAGAGSVDYIEHLETSRRSTTPSLLTLVLTNEPQLASRVARTLYEHNLNAVFELLLPSSAEFQFQPGRTHGLGDELSHDTESLLSRAEQRLDVWRDIAEQVPSTSAKYRLRARLPNGSPGFEVSPQDWRYLALIDGERTVADLVTETGHTAFGVCSTLYRLLLEQVIEPVNNVPAGL